MAVRESDIMQMITSDQSWEQIMQEIITSEGLDPWDLDVGKLSDSFGTFVGKLETMDFKLPAKYVIIAAVLLRMKSDDLQLLDFGREQDVFEPENSMPGIERVDVDPLAMPARRMVHRRIVVEELIAALRRVLATQERRDLRQVDAPSIRISHEDIEERINSLYGKVNMLMAQAKGDVKFSEVVPKWEREHIVDAFLPLMHLDNSRRLHCRQDDFFKDIFIGRVESNLTGKSEVIEDEEKNHRRGAAKAKPR